MENEVTNECGDQIMEEGCINQIGNNHVSQ